MKNKILLLILQFLFLGTSVYGNPLAVGKKIKNQTLGVHKITMDLYVLKNVKNFKDKKNILIEVDDNKSIVFVPKHFYVGKKEDDFSWTGKSKDSKAKAILSVRNGVMVGTITQGKDTYKLYPENGHFKVIKIDPSKVIPFHDDIIRPKEKTMMPLPELKQGNVPSQEDEALYLESEDSSSAVQASEPSATDSVVTLLVYYTQSLKDMYGASTEAMIQNNLDLAKDAYIDSDTEINLQVGILKLVPAGSLLSTADSGDLNDLLTKLKSDGFVRYERELYNADAVTVFSNYPDDGTGCGLGVTPLSTTSSLVDAYSAVHIKPAGNAGYYCSDLTFAHELGHNFGCQHDDDHASYTGMYPYAYGYDVSGSFGTIMSYDGPEINYFSNPNINDASSGLAIGNADNADNARAIRENQLKMADNSEDISEALEVEDNDVLDNYLISGQLNDSNDRDAYVMWLEGTTRFVLDNNIYSNNPYYINLYNEDTHQLVSSFNASDQTITLDKARYRVTVAFSNDTTGSYYNLAEINYTAEITTEYVEPAFNHAMPAIINYLLN